jgi:phosphopantetheinyl transferase (holo-ACP synthase)
VIIGIGSDLCEIERIEATLARHGARFTARCFTEIEQRRSIRCQGSLLQSVGHWIEAWRFLA